MKSVVICGSRRFKAEAKKFANELEKLGVVVYAPYHHSGQDEWEKFSKEYQTFIALGLTHDHFYKIRMADVVFVYNKGGYAGPSTTLEIGFAVALGKPIYALAPDSELCRNALFREVIRTPKELSKRLR
ncbi:MAG: nucleoside 2-deoxyribosyltransferase [bacterium]|nr:nucleoside 2-deoxyribosyltransferase [bacterium]